MINLFSRIYVNYDVDLRAGKNQQRIFVTNRLLPFPISEDPIIRSKLGIVSHHTDVEVFLKEMGGLEQTIEKLLAANSKICIIANPEFATLLHMCVFKSLMHQPKLEAAYTFYRATYMHQRASSLNTLTSFEDAGAFQGDFPAMLTLEEFTPIYDQAIVCKCLKSIEPTDIPIEYLMANYLASNDRTGLTIYFMIKYRAIALENAIFRIRVLRNEILTNCVAVSRYLGKEIDEIHALDELIQHPPTAWLADQALSVYSEEDAIRKYTVHQLLDIYTSIEELLGIKIDERQVLEYLAAGRVPELIELDMQDERGNFIGTEHFFSKVNGVFINKCYQEARKGNTAFFQDFKLDKALYPTA